MNGTATQPLDPLEFALAVDEAQQAQLAHKLASIRKARNYSQESVAKHIGISRSHLSNIEGGRSTPGSQRLLAMAAYYDVDLKSLIEQSNVLPLPDAAKHRLQDLWEQQHPASRSPGVATFIGVAFDTYEAWILEGLATLPSEVRRELFEELKIKIESALKGR